MATKKLKTRKSSKVKLTGKGTQILGQVSPDCVAYHVHQDDVQFVAESMSQVVNRNYQLKLLRALSPYMGGGEDY